MSNQTQEASILHLESQPYFISFPMTSIHEIFPAFRKHRHKYGSFGSFISGWLHPPPPPLVQHAAEGPIQTEVPKPGNGGPVEKERALKNIR